VLVYKSLHGFKVQYLTDDCQLVVNSGYRTLCSADVDTCIPRMNSRLGDMRFAVTGLWLWNTLPAEKYRKSISQTLNLSHSGGCSKPICLSVTRAH